MNSTEEKLYRWLMLADDTDVAILCANYVALFPDAELEADNPMLLTYLYIYLSNAHVHTMAYGSQKSNERFWQLVKGVDIVKAKELSVIYQELANNPLEA